MFYTACIPALPMVVLNFTVVWLSTEEVLEG